MRSAGAGVEVIRQLKGFRASAPSNLQRLSDSAQRRVFTQPGSFSTEAPAPGKPWTDLWSDGLGNMFHQTGMTCKPFCGRILFRCDIITLTYMVAAIMVVSGAHKQLRPCV